jgi:hypothetical protein
MGTLNITTPTPHSTIKQVTLQIPKMRSNYKNKKTIREMTDTCKFALT